ncbi:MAG: helix-turn-helix transcriptional regulator [Chitinophagaceae bacterium]|nr:helix-turn-helix transcriptional regulator [Chitinophagaceae bacterium]MBP6232574.1 helix-turn-helix transcriptional regulator [Chitinophagaceae bacterium]
MLFEFNRFSSLLLIFFVHGLVYAILLWRKGIVNETRSDKWLSIFLFLCILYIAPWMIGFAGWYDTQPYRDILFYLPFQQLYFIGPVIFFYVQSLLNPSFRFGKKEWLHLLPGILYLLFSIIMVVTDKLVLKKYYFLANGQDPDFDTWYQLTGFASMLFYFFLSLRYYNLYKKLIVQVVSYAELVSFRWVRNFLVAFLIMLFVKIVFFILEEITDLSYWDTWWYFLVFAILFYYIAISGYANSVETKVAFKPHLLTYRPTLLLNYSPSLTLTESVTEEAEIIAIGPASKDSVADEVLTEWKPKLLRLMQEEKIYEDPELSLTQVAKQLQSNPSFISMVVNRGFELNFNDFVNQFRIEAVKEMLKKGEHKKQTLLGIAYECGFNSKATFNRAFKKVTGLTPKEWVQQNG